MSKHQRAQTESPAIEQQAARDMTGAETRAAGEQARAPQGRAERVPLGTPRLKMQAPHRAGFRRRWVNDTPGRIQNAINGGYEHVADEIEHRGGQHKSAIVGVGDAGEPLKAYLMEIPEHLYEQDQAAKGAVLDQTDEAIKRGGFHGDVGTDGRYVPKDGIKIERR